MKKKALLKEILREIRRTKNRFLSILAIVAIGTGFFAGVKSTCPDMQLTAKEYFKEYNLMDIHLVSTMGFSENDMEFIRSEDDISGIMPAYSLDAFLIEDGQKSSTIIRAMSYKLDLQKDDPNYITQPVLKEGRMPEKPGECLVEKNMHTPDSFVIGNTVQLASGKEDSDILDTIKRDTFNIVGIIESPAYIAYERGITNIGDGEIDAFIMIPEDDFDLEVYTDVYITLDSTKALSPFSSEYKDIIEKRLEDFEDLAEIRTPLRYKEVLAEANEKLGDAKKELEDGIKKQKEELEDAQRKINDAAVELVDGRDEYEREKEKFYNKLADAQKELKDAEKKLEEGAEEYREGRLSYREGLKEYSEEKPKALEELKKAEKQASALEKSLQEGEEKLTELKSLTQEIEGVLSQNITVHDISLLPPEIIAVVNASQQLDTLLPEGTLPPGVSVKNLMESYLTTSEEPSKEGLKQQILALTSGAVGGAEAKLNEGKQGLSLLKSGISSGYKKLEDAAQELDYAKKELNKAYKQLEKGRQELADGQQDYEEGKAKGEKELSDALVKIRDGEVELAQARIDYQEGKEDSDKEIAEARAEIANAEKELEDLKQPEWFVWDRNNNPGYSTYQEDTEKVDAIAKVFPVFFILVAALVCLTTMTRMVEEQRTQIGTLKALGYSRGLIMLKYLIYAVLASITGSAIGLAIGFRLFPIVIINAYKIMYNLPSPITPFRWDYALWITLAAVACTGLSALAACYRELYASPARLMRPKAPKAGKRVLLERITPIWSRLSFTQKVTLRNIFRYKKRVLMTVVGIAGCTALMLTGFALHYSISSIVEKQYCDVFLFDAIAAIDDKATAQELEELEGLLDGSPEITGKLFTLHKAADASSSGITKSVNIFVPQEKEQIATYVNLRERIGQKPLELTDHGVIINEKLAKMLKVTTGDSISLKNAEDKSGDFIVTGITENYTFNYVYMTPNLYREEFGFDPVYNTFVFNMTDTTDESTLSDRLLRNDSMLGISYSSDGSRRFGDMIGSLGSIVWVLIISAGALAFIVLYNLTNINVNERIRELATIKVLGFYDNEVSAYIYRENTISSLIGIVVGLGGGVFLKNFVIATAETDIVMFAPDIKAYCFIYAAVLTMLFTLVVNIILHFKLKEIDMVESLKSVE